MLLKTLFLALALKVSASPLARSATPAAFVKSPAAAEADGDVDVLNNAWDNGWYDDDTVCTSQGRSYCGDACVSAETQCCQALGDGRE